MSWLPNNNPWIEILWATTVVGIALGAATLAIERFSTHAAWQRLAWLTMVLSLAVAALVEVCGFPRGVVEWANASAEAQSRLARDDYLDDEIAIPTAESSPTATIASPDESPNPQAFVSTAQTAEIESHQVIAEAGEPDDRATVVLSFWPGVAWGFITALLAARIVYVRLLLVRFVRSCQPAARQVTDQVAALAALFGWRRTICLYESSQLATPVAFGIWWPTIAVPKGFADRFDAGQREAMLAHELAHLASRDLFWQSVIDAIACVLWWQPLVWVARRRFRAACERAADEASAALPDGPARLASALVALGKEYVKRSPRLAWHGASGPFRSHLGQRVARLLEMPSRPAASSFRKTWSCVALLITLILAPTLVAGAAWATGKASDAREPQSQGETTMNTFRRSWQASLGGAMLYALMAPAPALADDDENRDEPRVAQREEKERDEAARDEERRLDEREVFAARIKEAQAQLKDARAQLEKQAEEFRKAAGAENLGPEAQAKLAEAKAQIARQHAELERQQARLQEEMAKLKLAQARPEREGGDRPNPERLKARVAELREAIAKATKEGRADEAERLEQEARAIMRRMERRGEAEREWPAERPTERREANRPDRERGEGERNPEARLQHLRQAVEHLRAAGMPDAADHLARMGEHIIRGGDGPPPRPPGRDVLPPMRREGDRPALPGRVAPPTRDPEPGRRADRDRNPEVGELREQVQQLRREMAEMRELLKKSAESRGERQ